MEVKDVHVFKQLQSSEVSELNKVIEVEVHTDGLQQQTKGLN
jgi:hypothetical protein